MSVASLRNVATSDQYSEAATLNCPGASVVNVSVRNAAVLMQLGVGTHPPLDWQPVEGIFLAPVDRSFPRRPGRAVDGVRFKSAKTATPAQVSADSG